MQSRLDKFNTLPPKPEHIKKIRFVLNRANGPLKLADLVAETGLTNTQALCALDLLIKIGEAHKEHGVNSFQIISKEAAEQKESANHNSESISIDPKA